MKMESVARAVLIGTVALLAGACGGDGAVGSAGPPTGGGDTGGEAASTTGSGSFVFDGEPQELTKMHCQMTVDDERYWSGRGERHVEASVREFVGFDGSVHTVTIRLPSGGQEGPETHRFEIWEARVSGSEGEEGEVEVRGDQVGDRITVSADVTQIQVDMGPVSDGPSARVELDLAC